jgi:hypothetical protein
VSASSSRQPKVDGKRGTTRITRPRGKRARRDVETGDYLKAARRFIRAAGRRVADGDEAELAGLLKLHDVLNEATQHAVDGQLAMGKSWRDIAAATGKSTQAAHKRWGGRATA